MCCITVNSKAVYTLSHRATSPPGLHASYKLGLAALAVLCLNGLIFPKWF